MRRISLFHNFGGVGERFTGIATTRKILKSNEQMVERVARAKLVAINYILNPANKKSVLQTMAKNQGSESGENQSHLLGHRGRAAAQHLSDGAGCAVGSKAYGGTGNQPQSVADQNRGCGRFGTM